MATAPRIDAIETSVTNEIVYLKDIKPDGTSAPTPSGGTWNIRDLTTLEKSNSSIAWISLNDPEFTLQAGTYEFDALAPAYRVVSHRIRLWNITDGITAIVGYGARSWSSGATQSDAPLKGIITITAQKDFRIEHYCGSAFANGLGNAMQDTDEDELYTVVKISRLGSTLL